MTAVFLFYKKYHVTLKCGKRAIYRAKSLVGRDAHLARLYSQDMCKKVEYGTGMIIMKETEEKGGYP